MLQFQPVRLINRVTGRRLKLYRIRRSSPPLDCPKTPAGFLSGVFSFRTLPNSEPLHSLTVLY